MSIPGWVCVEVAKRYGCAQGETVVAHCEYCGVEGSVRWWEGLTHATLGLDPRGDRMEWDHVYPKSLGGPNTPENITISCRWCNRKKHNKVLA